MIMVDTSAWIEYFRNGDSTVVAKVDQCLAAKLVCTGDLVYCEIMQGIRSARYRKEIGSLLLALPKFEMVGFNLAERSAANYRMLRSRGVSVRKTIDMIIGTFCVENGHQIIHFDRDFDLMAEHIGLEII